MGLRHLESPHAPTATGGRDLRGKVAERQRRDLEGREPDAEDGQRSRRKDVRPHPEQLGERAVQLVTHQRLQSRAFFAQALKRTPIASQREIRLRLQLGPRRHAGAQQVGNLLGVRDIPLVAPHLPCFPHAERRQRIHQDIRKGLLPQDIGHRFPQMPGRLKGIYGSARMPALRCRAPNELGKSRSGVIHTKARQPTSVGGEDHGVMALSPQVKADCDIVWSQVRSVCAHHVLREMW
jgi:hypothetical protein